MRFPKQFVGGVLFGLAFGIMLGAALAEGKMEVNDTSLAGVGSLLAVAGVAMARAGSPRSGEKGGAGKKPVSDHHRGEKMV
jgi:hypothetical protein